jgi:hypothetical protein
MTLLGGQDTGLGNVDTAGQAAGGGDGAGTVKSVTGVVSGIVDNTDPTNPVIEEATPTNAGAIPAVQEAKLEAIASPGWFDAQALFLQSLDPALTDFEYLKPGLNPNGLTVGNAANAAMLLGPNVLDAHVPGGALQSNQSWTPLTGDIVTQALSAHWAVGGRFQFFVPVSGAQTYVGLTDDIHSIFYVFNWQFALSPTFLVLSNPVGTADHVTSFVVDTAYHDFIMVHVPGAPGSLRLFIDGLLILSVSDATMVDGHNLHFAALATANTINIKWSKGIVGSVPP